LKSDFNKKVISPGAPTPNMTRAEFDQWMREKKETIQSVWDADWKVNSLRNYAELRNRGTELLKLHQHRWLKESTPFMCGHRQHWKPTWCGGFVEKITCRWQLLQKYFHEIVRQHPLRHVGIANHNWYDNNDFLRFAVVLRPLKSLGVEIVHWSEIHVRQIEKEL